MAAVGDIIQGSDPKVWLVQAAEPDRVIGTGTLGPVTSTRPAPPIAGAGLQRRWIPDPATLLCIDSRGAGAVQHLADADLNALREGPPLPSRADGTVLKGSGSEIYVVQGCQRKLVPDTPTLNTLGGWGAVRGVIDSDLSAIPEGGSIPPVPTPIPVPLREGDLVQVAGQPQIFLLEGGLLRLVPDMATFYDLDLNPAAVKFITIAQIGTMSFETPLPASMRFALDADDNPVTGLVTEAWSP
jgi:hypothetical protein